MKLQRLAHDKGMHERRIRRLQFLKKKGGWSVRSSFPKDDLDSTGERLGSDLKSLIREGLVSTFDVSKRKRSYCITPPGEDYLKQVDKTMFLWDSPSKKTSSGAALPNPKAVSDLAYVLMNGKKTIQTSWGPKDKNGVVSILSILSQSQVPGARKEMGEAEPLEFQNEESEPVEYQDNCPIDRPIEFDDITKTPGKLEFYGSSFKTKAHGLFQWEIRRLAPHELEKEEDGKSKVFILEQNGEQFDRYHAKVEAIKAAEEYESMALDEKGEPEPLETPANGQSPDHSVSESANKT